MRFGRDVDYARRRRGDQPRTQQRRKPEIAHVVEGETALESIRHNLPACKERARVVEQNVDSRGGVEQGASEPNNLIAVGEIRIVHLSGYAGHPGAQAASPLSRLRPTSTSRALSAPSRAAASSPIPPVAPVIMQVLPFTCSPWLGDRCRVSCFEQRELQRTATSRSGLLHRIVDRQSGTILRQCLLHPVGRHRSFSESHVDETRDCIGDCWSDQRRCHLTYSGRMVVGSN